MFLVWCQEHECCIGMEVMRDKETEATPFTMLIQQCKAPPQVVIYDNACNLMSYALNREPKFFKDTLFLVDSHHWTTSHKACSTTFNSSNYPKLVSNSSLAEQKNSRLDLIKTQVGTSLFTWYKLSNHLLIVIIVLLLLYIYICHFDT
jgi:hypothetical protein